MFCVLSTQVFFFYFVVRASESSTCIRPSTVRGCFESNICQEESSGRRSEGLLFLPTFHKFVPEYTLANDESKDHDLEVREHNAPIDDLREYRFILFLHMNYMNEPCLLSACRTNTVLKQCT